MLLLLQVLLDMAFCHLNFGKDPEASLRCASLTCSLTHLTGWDDSFCISLLPLLSKAACPVMLSVNRFCSSSTKAAVRPLWFYWMSVLLVLTGALML